MDACILFFAVSASVAGFTRNYHSRGHIRAANNYIGEHNLALIWQTQQQKIITQHTRVQHRRFQMREALFRWKILVRFFSTEKRGVNPTASPDLRSHLYKLGSVGRVHTLIYLFWTIFSLLFPLCHPATQLTQMIIISARFKIKIKKRAVEKNGSVNIRLCGGEN